MVFVAARSVCAFGLRMASVLDRRRAWNKPEEDGGRRDLFLLEPLSLGFLLFATPFSRWDLLMALEPRSDMSLSLSVHALSELDAASLVYGALNCDWDG